MTRTSQPEKPSSESSRVKNSLSSAWKTPSTKYHVNIKSTLQKRLSFTLDDLTGPLK